MKRQFVKTSNTEIFLAGLGALENRGAEEACLMVVDGEPGLGKTTIIQWWTTQTDSVFLRAKKEWTPAWFMRELLGSLGVVPRYSFEKMYQQAIEQLVVLATDAERNERTFAVVIDEVDHISRNARLLETIRDLSDMLEIPFILVGMGKVRDNLTRFKQISSRVARYVQFQPASTQDVRTMVNAVCEVPVSENLIELLRKESGGKLREIKEGINNIEKFGKRNAGQTVDVTQMAGQVLLNDRKTGREIKVRSV